MAFSTEFITCSLANRCKEFTNVLFDDLDYESRSTDMIEIEQINGIVNCLYKLESFIKCSAIYPQICQSCPP